MNKVYILHFVHLEGTYHDSGLRIVITYFRKKVFVAQTKYFEITKTFLKNYLITCK